MDINLFAKVVKRLGTTDLDDFSCVIEGKIYGFRSVGEDEWDDQGKYQYRHDKGQLIEMAENYSTIKAFPFGVSRSVQRSGSYFSSYHYEKGSYSMFELKEVFVPEVVIPAHTDIKWSGLAIDLNTVVDAEEEERKRIEAEKLRLEEEEKAEKQRLAKLYAMNNPKIIDMVRKKLKKKGRGFTINDMRREYFAIVVEKKLENQEWIDYNREKLQEENSTQG